jgi:hypothetical protein
MNIYLLEISSFFLEFNSYLLDLNLYVSSSQQSFHELQIFHLSPPSLNLSSGFSREFSKLWSIFRDINSNSRLFRIIFVS